MCKECNGTHVIHEYGRAIGIVMPCPICGPEPVEKYNARMAEIRRKVEHVKSLMAKGGVGI